MTDRYTVYTKVLKVLKQMLQMKIEDIWLPWR